MLLSSSIEQLGSVGKKTANLLKRLQIYTIEDLLYYFPFRYEDYRRIVSIAELKDGEQVTVKAQVELIANKRSFKSKKMITECLVRDATESLRVVWFNQPFLIKTLHPGDVVYLSGKVVRDMVGPELISPVYEKEKKGLPAQAGETTHTARLVPIYPLTAGLTEKQLRFLISQIIDLTKIFPDWLPEEVLHKQGLISLSEALQMIHFPKSEEEVRQSTERLKFDELLLIQLQAELARLEKEIIQAPSLEFKEEKIKQFVRELGFTLTLSQRKSAWEILQDIAKTIPMNRLLSGDVGSGKTVVAAIALYDAFLNNREGVIMVPTEILAKQHFDSLCVLLGKYGVRIGLFTRSQRIIFDSQKEVIFTDQITHENIKKISKNKLLEAIKNHQIDVTVGTQAFLSEQVEYNNLGIVIVDEQHRFGVEQRRIIKEKGRGVHFLSMTATPIPRSFALMIYGDLDVSIINELPPGRKKIITRFVEPSKRTLAYGFIHEQIKQGRQVFVICPLIEEADPLGDKKSVLKEYKKLSEEIFPDIKVGYLHGKLKSEEKEEIMHKFSVHELDLLVSTSVIEVGVNIPNAAVMMIEGAERFGLAQLHQFRGRVGRSNYQSYCLLFTESASSKVEERLKFFEGCLDGFKLAEKDLELRGPGEVYGTEQSGMMHLRLVKLTDQTIIKKSREVAKELAPEIQNYPNILKRVKKWKEVVHLE